jgi:hypothetical protein
LLQTHPANRTLLSHSFFADALGENDYAQALYAASGIDKLRSFGAGDEPIGLELKFSTPDLTYSVLHRRWHASARQTIETVFSVFTQVLGLAHVNAHSYAGLYARIAAKAAAFNVVSSSIVVSADPILLMKP